MQAGVDITPFKKELENFFAQGGRWEGDRAEYLYEQQHTKNITLRRSVLPTNKKIFFTKELKVQYSANTEYNELNPLTFPFFQKTYAYIEEFVDKIGGQTTKAMIVSLNPHSQVYLHCDNGAYYKNKDRYHLPIKTKGSINKCGGEIVTYHEGELWWFDNKKEHEAFNDSDEDRIHIIFDVLPTPRGVLRKVRDWLEKKASLARFDISE